MVQLARKRPETNGSLRIGVFIDDKIGDKYAVFGTEYSISISVSSAGTSHELMFALRT